MSDPLPMSELFEKVRRLHLMSRKPVTEFLAGGYRSTFKGTGVEFFEVRDYRDGDDVDLIDWNVTARTGALHIKTFTEEREQSVLLLVDLSASAAFGSGDVSKAETAAELCALISLSAAMNNDRVGLILFTDRVEKHLPLRKGMDHGLRIVREVLGFTPRGAATGIEGALARLMQVRKRRSVVFLISDFLDSGYEQALSVAARRHDLTAVVVRDPREKRLQGKGIARLRDLESGRMVNVDLSSRRVREQYTREAEERDEALRRQLLSLGADPVEVEAGEDCALALRRFFHRRVAP